MSKHKFAPVIALLCVTAVWGLTFVMVKDAISKMPVMDFLAIRFVLATAVMVIARPFVLRRLDRKAWGYGIILGILLGACYIAQTFGLLYTSAAVSGFITGMFVIFTPLIAGIALRHKIGLRAWIAVLVAFIGLALISLKGFSVGPGELLTLLCAFLYSAHIVCLGEWSSGRDPYAFAVVQLGVVGLMSSIAALPGGITLPPDSSSWIAILVTAVLASAAAFFIQTWAQTMISPTRVAIILTMEPVFAGFFAVLIGGEYLGLRTIAGAVLVISAMYLVELGPRHSKEGEVAHLEV